MATKVSLDRKLLIFVEQRKQMASKKKRNTAKKTGQDLSSRASTNTSISTNEMLQIVEQLKCEGKRTSTRRIYQSVWKTFNEFYIKLDLKPETWEERITLFVAYLVDDNKKSSTIKSYISAIKAVLQEDGVEINENKYLLASLTKACRLKNDHVRTRLPIRQRMLNMILKEVDNYYNNQLGQEFLGNLYKAMFASAFYGLLRVGEVASGSHPIYATDVHIGHNKKKIMFILHTSKTHWKDMKPQIVKIYNYKSGQEDKAVKAYATGSGGSFCPYQILRDYSNCRPSCKSITEPFFVFRDRSPVKPEQIHSVLKSTLQMAGFEPKLYDFHSFRIGMATQLLEKKFSIEKIKILGRWRSNSVYKYLR